MNPYLYDNTVSANVAAAGNIQLINLFVPQRQVFKIKKLANFVSNNLAWGSVYWVINNNGNIIPFFGTIYDQLGTQNRPFEVNYDFNLTGVLNITAYNSYTSTVGMGIRLIGEFE